MAMTPIEDRRPRTTIADDGMTTSWPEPVRRAMVNRDVLATGIEMLKADLGLRIVPCNEDKKPITALCEHWSKDATRDPQTWRQWLAVWPDAGMAIIPGERFVVIDDDTGDLDPGSLGIDGTWAERTSRGVHYWCMVPEGHRSSRKTKLPGNRGDVITGGSGYVITSPTDPRRSINVDALILTLPSLELLRPQRTGSSIQIPPISARHHREARRIIAELLRAPYGIGADMASLLKGKVPKDASPSEAEYRLILCASFWTLDPGEIMAILLASNLSREKWCRADYLPQTFDAAFQQRAILSAQGPNSSDLHEITRYIITGRELLALPVSTTVSYGTSPVGQGRCREIVDSVLAFGASVHASDMNSDWDRPEGWIRIPVNNFALIHQVDRKTVQRVIKEAERTGLIECDEKRLSRGGKVRCERLIRLPRSHSVFLSLPVPLVVHEHEEAA